MPNKDQIDSIGGEGSGSTTYISSFSPVLGGIYGDGSLRDKDTRGAWWSSIVYNNASRYYLGYDAASIWTGARVRLNGIYVRCVQAS